MSSISTSPCFHDAPWPANRCQVLLSSCTSLSASVPPIPPLQRIYLSLPLREPDRTHALSFCVTCVPTSTLSRRPVGACSLLGLLSVASRGPDLSWDSCRAFHTSQRSQHWPVDRSAHLTDVASSLRLRHRCALTPCVGDRVLLPWQHRTPSVLRARNLFCSSHTSA